MSDEEDNRRRSSRHPVNKEKDVKASALERLKEARMSGKRTYRQRVDDIVQDVLIDVDEDEYNRRYRAADFVDDDDGAGYADSDEDEEKTHMESSKTKRKTTKSEQRKNTKAGDITKFLRPDAKSSEKANINHTDNDAALAEALAQLEEAGDSGPPVLDFLTDQLDNEWKNEHDEILNVPEIFKPATIKRVRRVSEDEICAPKIARLEPVIAPPTELQPEGIDDSHFVQTKTVAGEIKSAEETKVEDMLEDDLQDDTMEDEQEETIDGNGKSINFYCLDFCEHNNKGTVFMFGKLGPNSCCIEVKGIERVVYFVPVQEEMEDLKREVTSILKQHGITLFRSKETTIKYVPDADDMENEMKVLMVAYDSSKPALAIDLSGTYFKRVLNVSASPLERLLIEANLRTPGFLNVSNIESIQNKKSHCAVEYSVNNRSLKNIKMLPEHRFPPKMRLLVMNIASAILDNGMREIVALSGLFKSNAFIDRGNNKIASSYQTLNFIAKPTKGTLPISLNDVIACEGAKDKIFVHQSERALLAAFLVKVKDLDPDIIVMHDATAQLDLLKSKLAKHKISTYTFLSKLKNTVPIDKINRYNMSTLTAGRLVLCSKEAAAELCSKSKSQDMADLVPTLLTPNDPKIVRSELMPSEFLDPFFSSNGIKAIFKLLNWCHYEAYLSLRIILQLNALPLFVKITQIVGGVMSRTLGGGRSQRNEYLFLHAFHERGYIPWDKKKRNREKKGENTGGKVLTPHQGLYETYIALLDFNSLYPSIIQEFNICFTTVDKCYRIAETDKVTKSLPNRDVQQGILPKEIGELVKKRRQVKQEMKKIAPGSDRYLQLDVEQLGLKLTANSMYGCLGATDFRFYANFLAVMVTTKGQSLLERSVEIAEKSYKVLYGDTDSIMVNTNTVKHNEAVQIALQLKKDLNGEFKYIEMDIDGLFKKFLLLGKKNYAALAVSMTDENDFKTEIKGLKIVKRDYSDVVRKAGRKVLDIILGSSDSKGSEIVTYLSEWKEALYQGKVPLEEFQMYERLNKDLKQYDENLKHANVARRLNLTGKFNFKSGDTVKYIVCQDGTSNTESKRVYHLSEIEEANKDTVMSDVGDDKENMKPFEPKLIVDYKYYQESLKKLVSDLCQHLEGVERYQLSEALGLDASKDRSCPKPTNYMTENTKPNDIDYDEFTFECPHCQKNVIVRTPVTIQKGVVIFTLQFCPECEHDLTADQPYLLSRFHQLMNEYITRNSKSPFKCGKCEYKEYDVNTLSWSSHKYVPSCPECGSNLTQEYDVAQLCDQQQSFVHLFDLNHFLSRCKNLGFKKRIETDTNYQQMKCFYNKMSAIARQRWICNSAFKIDLSSLLRSFRLK